MGRLDGSVIATTRESGSQDALVQRLRDEGARVLVWPTLVTEGPRDPEPLRAAADELARYDWVIFTSARAVPGLSELVPNPPRSVCVAVVGEATAAAVREHGWKVTVTGGGTGARGLAETVSEFASLDGARVLFPAGSLARPVLEEELRALGARVDRVEAYHTRETPPDGRLVREDLAAGVDVVTFASPSAVRSLSQALDDDLAGALSGVGVAAIGRTTADALEELGVADVEVGGRAGMAGLVDACVTLVQRSVGDSSHV
jgi:uroporphyrinogen-III synthase